jgi:hypothetical protein
MDKNDLITRSEEIVKSIYARFKAKGISLDQQINEEYEMSEEDKEYYKQFFSYYLKFYNFNKSTDQRVLDALSELSETGNLVDRFIYNDNGQCEESDEFIIKVNYGRPLSIIFKEIDHKVSQIKGLLCFKFMLHEIYFNIDYIKNEAGDVIYKTKFKLWERYIRVRELVGDDINIVTNEKLNKIGDTLKKEFNIFHGTEYTNAMIRRDIKRDYHEAAKLIKSAAECTFPDSY